MMEEWNRTVELERSHEVWEPRASSTIRMSNFLSWLRGIVIWYALLPASILYWMWHWRYPVLWISSLSILYFSSISLGYYQDIYPENAVTVAIMGLSVVLTLWGYYNHRMGNY